MNNNIFWQKISITPTHQTLKDGSISGSSDSGEVDIDSDIHFLASGDLRQYTTVPINCDWLSYTWTRNILYLYCWSYFLSALVLFSMLRGSQYNYNKGYVIVDNIRILTIHGGLFFIIFLLLISLRWVINIGFIYVYVIVRVNGNNVPLYIYLQKFSYVWYVSD